MNTDDVKFSLRLVLIIQNKEGCHPVFVSPFGGNAKTDTLHKLTRTYDVFLLQ